MPSLYIVLEKEIPEVDAYVNGSFLSKYNDVLTSLAKRAGVETLMSFFSASKDELAAFAGDHGVLSGKAKIPDEQWFAADDGLRTVNALLRNLETARLPQSDRIASELREFATLLELAKDHGVRWHLAVDY